LYTGYASDGGIMWEWGDSNASDNIILIWSIINILDIGWNKVKCTQPNMELCRFSFFSV
jgi:hypothetical protein